MDDNKRALIVDFVNRSFRDVADKDYISARILYRYDLGPQFLWAALQAVEKYLKAILLYNLVSTKELRHDIEAAFKKLPTITDIPFDFPKHVVDLITYLNGEGANRYFEYPAFALGEELLELDRAVWHIRRYCYSMRWEQPTGSGRTNMFPDELKRIQSYKPRDAHKYRISGGYLEKVLDGKRTELRHHLVWKNFYYGSYKKRRIKRFVLRTWSANPTHYLDPDVFTELDRLVRFSKEVRDLFLRKKTP